MVTVGGLSGAGVKSSTVVAPLLCSIRRNIVGGNPAAVATNACMVAMPDHKWASIPCRYMSHNSLLGSLSRLSRMTAIQLASETYLVNCVVGGNKP